MAKTLTKSRVKIVRGVVLHSCGVLSNSSGSRPPKKIVNKYSRSKKLKLGISISITSKVNLVLICLTAIRRASVSLEKINANLYTRWRDAHTA